MRSVYAIALGGILFLTSCSTTPPPQTVAAVDLQRYSGTWFEIARIPNRFQRRCAHTVTATYEPNPDGSIRVINSCRDKNGEFEKIVGKATVVENSGNAKLKVTFGGLFTGDYWILALDPNYQWALVGHPSRNFLWILSRQRHLPEKTIQAILARAAAQGYDVSRVARTTP